MRVAQHMDEVGIDVFDLGRFGVKQQDSVLGSFKYPTVAGFGHPQGFTLGMAWRASYGCLIGR